ncbi:MAG: hypothetical protein HY235_27110 [Acidobacteria bacterium]|nr:hypothetical protein [Acidobacteriota bacterium]
MKKFAFLSLFAMSAFAAEWTGYISDSGCGAKHNDGSERSMKCVSGCVKGKGAAPVFVVGDKVYKIDDASKSKVMDHLGHKVTVNGKLSGETVSIDSVAMAN